MPKIKADFKGMKKHVKTSPKTWKSGKKIRKPIRSKTGFSL
ncbi:MAG: hypothetical protein PHU45_02765 [Bacilli bacterium]|nr:hypothetical protein [Bacilli bacterium]